MCDANSTWARAFPSRTHSPAQSAAVRKGSQRKREKIISRRQRYSPPAVREMEGPFRYPPMSSTYSEKSMFIFALAPKYMCPTDFYTCCENAAAAHTARRDRETCHMALSPTPDGSRKTALYF